MLPRIAATTLALCVLAAACGGIEDVESDDERSEGAGAALIDRLEGLGRGLTDAGASGASGSDRRDAILPGAGGEYSAGWFTGHCEKRGRPEQPAIGQTYQVVTIETDFQLWVNDRWDFDVRVAHPYSGPGYEYRCTPEQDRVLLPARFLQRSEMPARYRMVTRGTITHYEVRECLAVVGGPCPIHVGTDETREEVEFTVVR